jgi:hypothetical protein
MAVNGAIYSFVMTQWCMCMTGKATHIGVSNYNEVHLKELLENCRVPPSLNQVSNFWAVYYYSLVMKCYSWRNDNNVLN